MLSLGTVQIKIGDQSKLEIPDMIQCHSITIALHTLYMNALFVFLPVCTWDVRLHK